MKTTIELPDELALRARRFVAASGRSATLRDLVVAGLETELDRRERPPRVEFQWITVDGDGLQADPAQVSGLAHGLPT